MRFDPALNLIPLRIRLIASLRFDLVQLASNLWGDKSLSNADDTEGEGKV